MKKASIFIALMFVFSCNQGVYNTSRQFKITLTSESLTTDGKAIQFKTTSYYEFSNETEKLFDEKGYFITEDYNMDPIIVAITRSAIRSVSGRFTLKNFDTISTSYIQDAIFHEIRTMNIDSASRKGFDIQFNYILLDELN